MGKKRLRTIMDIAAALMAAAGIVLAICPVSIKAGTDSGKALEDAGVTLDAVSYTHLTLPTN